MIVTIDGPAGSGKSTIARELARQEGFVYLDTGAMYRAVAYAVLEARVSPDDTDGISRMVDELTIECKPAQEMMHVYLNGREITREIRTDRVNAIVSRVASIAAVRKKLVALQRRFAAQADVIAEGRDMGTVVFPHAEVKVFLYASPSVRAYRRAVQNASDMKGASQQEVSISPDEQKRVLAELTRRDQEDTARVVSPLAAADDAVHIDSTHLSLDEVCSKIAQMIHTVRGTNDA